MTTEQGAAMAIPVACTLTGAFLASLPSARAFAHPGAGE